MTHHMNLNPIPFAQIVSGQKTIELRLNDPKRQKVMAGDLITFTNTEDDSLQITVRVVKRLAYSSYEELFEDVPLAACGFSPELTIDEAILEMRKYYTESQEKKFGALGIEIELL